MEYPIKVVQFGEGNFLRAFVDFMIDDANSKGVFEGRVAVVKPISNGSLADFKEQHGLFTLLTRGIINGKLINNGRVVNAIADTADAYGEYDKVMSYAQLEELTLIVSNTTEAGIVFEKQDRFEDIPPKGYPSKLTKFLYRRFEAFQGDQDKGLYILPCELIENNGSKLKECVMATIDNWNLPKAFLDWVNDCCVFCNTLVDRIVTGYPRDEADQIEKKLGYKDKLIDVCEPFALWVIENKKEISRVFPLDKAGLPVVFTDDVAPFRERKVRILNGAHTTTVLAGYLSGKKIVRECMQDKIISLFMKTCLYNEIIPTLTLDRYELLSFTNSVIERFSNPYIDHSLLSISLNSVSKWKARVLCSLKDYYRLYNEMPRCIVFSFAALLAFYMGSEINKCEPYDICDDKDMLIWVRDYALRYQQDKMTLKAFVQTVAGNEDFWGEDLTTYEGFCQLASSFLSDILAGGAYQAMKKLLEEK